MCQHFLVKDDKNHELEVRVVNAKIKESKKMEIVATEKKMKERARKKATKKKWLPPDERRCPNNSFCLFVCLNHIHVPVQHMQTIFGQTNAC